MDDKNKNKLSKQPSREHLINKAQTKAIQLRQHPGLKTNLSTTRPISRLCSLPRTGSRTSALKMAIHCSNLNLENKETRQSAMALEKLGKIYKNIDELDL